MADTAALIPPDADPPEPADAPSPKRLSPRAAHAARQTAATELQRATATNDDDWKPVAGHLRGAEKYGKIPTKGELARRRARIAEMLVMGYSRWRILDWVGQSTDWDVVPSTVDQYIRHGNAQIEENAKLRIKFRVGMVLSRLDMIASRALDAGELTPAIRATRETANLLSLAARVTPPQVQAPPDAPSTPPDDARAGMQADDVRRADAFARYTALAKQRRAASGG